MRLPSSRGATMVEALVALVVLSFAALAYAGLQLKGLTANSNAMWRSKAVQLAADMSDRLRANPSGAEAGAYDDLTAAPAMPACGAATTCTPAQMAAYDHAVWNDAVRLLVPQGYGAVCLDSTPTDGTAADPACDASGEFLVVKVFWRERDQDLRVWSMVAKP